MAVEQVKVHELVERAVGHRWSVPEFQRGFVWKATQVRDLAESLWRSYPIGSLLLWNSNSRQEERVAKDGVAPGAWIVDGQQRTTALAILFNRKPYWWASAEEWNKTLRRYDIRFDVAATDEPYFLVANAAIRRAKGDRYIPLSRLVTLDTERDADQKTLTDLAKAIKLQGLCDGMDAMDVYARLDQVRKIRSIDVITVAVDHELEEVVEIFSRLNSRGTRVTEADIYLGIVASHNPGWVRDEFLPFLGVLEDFGFRLDPNLLFRSLSAIGTGRVRFKEINDTFWDAQEIIPAWAKCKAAWRRLVRNLAEFGVLSDDPLPTKAALVTLAALSDRFPDEKSFHREMLWLVQASRYGRYSGSAATASEEDLRDIKESATRDEAVTRLMGRFRDEPFTAEDFRRDYTDGRFFTFLLYLMVFERKARDWDKNGLPLGFDGRELVADFRPQWHHVFPVKLLKDRFDDAEINQLANIAVIGPTINIRISAQSPMKYFDKYQISDEKLRQQFIDPDVRAAGPDEFGEFVTQRADALAAAASAYLAGLRAASPLAPISHVVNV